MDGELSPEEAREMQAHAGECSNCAQLNQTMRAMAEEMARMDSDLPVPPQCAADWRRAVQEDAAQAAPPKRSFWRAGWGRFAVAAAALVVVVGGFAALRGGLDMGSFQNASDGAASKRGTATSDVLYAMEEPMPAMAPQAAMEESGAVYDDMDAASADQETLSGGASLPAGALLEKRAWYGLSTQQFDADAEQLLALADQMGGWVETQSVSGKSYEQDGGGRQMNLLLRVPAEQMDAAMAQLSKIGVLEYQNITAEDIAESYYDTKGRLESAQALQTQLNALLERADSVEALAQLTKELSENQRQIDTLSGALRGMDSRVAYSRIDVSLSETRIPTLTPASGDSLGMRLRNGLVESLNAMRDFFAGLVVWLMRLLPWLILVGLVLFLIVWAVRRRRR